MKILQKRCLNCGELFEPDPRTARFQKFCGDQACQRARRRRKLRRWRILHPDRANHYQPKVRAWAKAYPNYWRRYRAGHANYRKRERQRMAAKRRRQNCVAKETAIRQIVVEKLRALDALKTPKLVANENLILRRVRAIEDCLRSTVAAVCVAKQTPIVRHPVLAG